LWTAHLSVVSSNVAVQALEREASDAQEVSEKV
jgi:hypothetical protein